MLKQIKDFDDYFITDSGCVYSLKSKRWLKPQKRENGYLQIKLGRGKLHYIHRLVAQAFIEKTKEDIKLGRDHIDHIDGNRQNNHISNLRWCTSKENHSFPLARENNRKAKEHTMKPVIIDNIKYESLHEAARQLNMYKSTIQRRCNSPKFKNYQYKER